MPGSADPAIIGVIANTRNAGLARDPLQIVNPLRRAVQAVDPDQPVLSPATFEEIVGRQTLHPPFNMALFSFFAMLGVALAAAGVFSVISYHVARRTHEIGVRVALGARQADISGLVVAMGAKVVCAGLVIGLIGTVVLVRTVQTQVFDLSLFDIPRPRPCSCFWLRWHCWLVTCRHAAPRA